MNKIFIIAVLAMTAISCKKDFIDLSPEDEIPVADFYKTEAQFRMALTAAYTPLRDLEDNDFYTGEMRSDNTHYQYYAVNRGTAYVMRENIADFVDDPTNNYTNNIYFHCFKGISRTNIILDRIDGGTLSDAAKNDIIGQAKFLRAFNFFKLVRYFGGVPLFIHEVTDAEQSFLPRSSASEVYAQIVDDAKDAIAKLANPVFVSGKQSGIATKGAATMLLAEVYMEQKKYADAEALLNTLPAMGYDLLPNYADVFNSTTNKNSKESIFEVQYLEGLQGGQQSQFIYYFLPRTSNTTPITGQKFDNSTLGGWNTPTQDMIDAYETDDKRKDASIAVAEGTYNASNIFTISANKSIINYTPAAGKTGVPYIKKYLNPHSNPDNTNDNWPVYRYADALLLLAEAKNLQGKPAEALVPLNKVRTRAFGNATHNITTTDPAALTDIIAHERRVELAFENHRWHDLVRTGKAIEVMNAFGVKQKQLYNYLPPNSYQVDKNRLLFPIPQSERELNVELTQNDGYPL
jgi:starch-binding outer membrane protein, SusD/RagB family